MMNTQRLEGDDNDEDFEDEDWMDTSWAQPNSHQQSEECRNDLKPMESSHSYQMDASNHLDELRLGSDKLSTSVVSSASEDMRKDITPEDPTVVKRMQLNDNKAGMEGLDKDRINQIIHEASKGSRFYENEKKKEEEMKRKIEEQKQKINSISEEQLKQGLIEADLLLEDFEQRRDLDHTIVHIDMDAFYAAVEMRDDPSLKNKPMAVGGTAMLSTSNYHARKFGVRAAMPGFIGKRLCPDLVIVPANFDKYTTVSKQVKSLIAEYDPNFCPMSLDEAYLNITEHLITRKALTVKERTFICRKEIPEGSESHCFCDLNDVVKQKGDSHIKTKGEEGNGISIREYFSPSEESLHGTGSRNVIAECPICGRPFPPFYHVTFGFSDEDTVKELRTRIEQRTRLTASAGIAPNMMLSKVCSDKNKPNGQYKIPATREAVMEFIKDLPTRKISGIGKVSEAMLNAVCVYTCTDLFNKRALLYHLYSQISFNYFMRICLGIGSTAVERTFQELSKPADLYKKCEELVGSLIEDLKDEELKGKTVSIKIKTVKFEVKTRAHTLPNHTNDRDAILQSAIDLLRTEIQACYPQQLRLRLMGVRMSNLANQSVCKDLKKQGTILGAFKKIEDKAKNTFNQCKTVDGNSAIDESLPLIKTTEDNNIAADNLVAAKGNFWTKHEKYSNDECDKLGFELASNLETGTSQDKDVVELNETGLKIEDEKLADDNILKLKLSSDNALKVTNKNSVEWENKNQVGKARDIVNGYSIGELVEEKHSINGHIAHISKDNKDKIKEQTCIEDCKSTNQVNAEHNSIPLNEKEVHRTRSGLVRSNKNPSRKRRNSKPEKLVVYSCPICSKDISCTSLTDFNDHVDDCLNEATLTDNSIVKDPPSEIKHLELNDEINEEDVADTSRSISVTTDENQNEKKLVGNQLFESSNKMANQDEELPKENFSSIEKADEISVLETDSLDNNGVLEISVKKHEVVNFHQENLIDLLKPTDSCNSNDNEVKSNEHSEGLCHINVKDKPDTVNNNVLNISDKVEREGIINCDGKDLIDLKNIQEDRCCISSSNFNSIEESCEQIVTNNERTKKPEVILKERDTVEIKELPLNVDQFYKHFDSEKVSNHEKDKLEESTNCDEMTVFDEGDRHEICNISQISEGPILKNVSPKPGCSWMSDNFDNSLDSDVDDSTGLLVCPVCNVEQRSADLNEFNSHVDSCLSRGAISQILKEQNRTTGSTLKRDRDVKKTPNHAPPTKKRKTILPNKSPSSCRTILSFFKDSQSV